MLDFKSVLYHFGPLYVDKLYLFQRCPDSSPTDTSPTR